MRRLVGDLFDIAVIESGALTVDATPCSANVLVDETGELPPISADGERLLQALGNLLGQRDMGGVGGGGAGARTDRTRTRHTRSATVEYGGSAGGALSSGGSMR